jgi:hypothetical protein
MNETMQKCQVCSTEHIQVWHVGCDCKGEGPFPSVNQMRQERDAALTRAEAAEGRAAQVNRKLLDWQRWHKTEQEKRLIAEAERDLARAKTQVSEGWIPQYNHVVAERDRLLKENGELRLIQMLEHQDLEGARAFCSGVEAERDRWEETAALYAKNEEHWRNTAEGVAVERNRYKVGLKWYADPDNWPRRRILERVTGEPDVVAVMPGMILDDGGQRARAALEGKSD